MGYDFIKAANDDLTDLYASLLKTLSLRLDSSTVQFFIVEETQEFPLLFQAISLLSSTDNMVKTAAKTVILKVLELDDPLVDKYAITPSITSFLAATLADDLGRLFTSLLNNVVDILSLIHI